MNRFIGFLLFVSLVLSSNPFFYLRIPASYILIYLGLILSTFLFLSKRRASYRSFVPSIFIASPLLIAYLCAFFYSPIAFSIPLYIIFSLSAVSILPFVSILSCARFLHIYASCLVLGSLIMVLYQLLGGSPLFELGDSSYRVLQFFPFSFSDSQLLSGFYRPSSMFDEPGTFACFLLGVLAITRTPLYRSCYSSSHWFFSPTILVIGGLSSLSFAFCVCLLLAVLISFMRRLVKNYRSFLVLNSRRRMLFTALLFLSFSIFILLFVDLRPLLEYLGSRFSFFLFSSSSNDSGRLTGLISSLSFLAEHAAISPNLVCLSDEAACGELNWNPVYYVVRDGILGSLSSVVFAIILVKSYLKTDNIWCLSFFFFFLQRTNWFYTWVALLAAILVGLILSTTYDRRSLDKSLYP